MDTELTNNKSRVAAIWGVGDGSDKGVAYAEEYLWHNKNQWDAKIVYLRQDTPISMAITDPSLPGSAKIRYKWNRDRQWFGKWCPLLAGSGNNVLLPQYTAPFTLADLQYEPGVPVLGTAGHNGAPQTSKQSSYWRAIEAPNGDLLHTFMFAIDNDTAVIAAGGIRDRASAIDAKSILIVEDPKAPAFTVRATGAGQFFTTLPKAYWTPRATQQTTYFTAGSGTVTFEIRDLYSNPVSYRINEGVWVDAGSSTITLDQEDFIEGENTLQYCYVGNEAFSVTRILVKNPDHPSKVEAHGHFLFGDLSGPGWSRILARSGRAPFASYLKLWREKDDFNGSDLEQWLANGEQGKRSAAASAVLKNAFIAKVYGWDWKQKSSHAKSVGRCAKDMLLETVLNVDTTGFEMQHSSDAVPNRTRHYRGYIDSWPILKALYAYDILAGQFRSDQVVNGLTPVEDYFIRDRFASWVHDALLWAMDGQPLGSPGMWGGCRMMAAMQIAIVMPEFSSPLWGTSGFGTAQTTYPDCPFGAGQQLTWKEALWDEDTELGEFPKLKWRFTPGLLFTNAPFVKGGVTYPPYSYRDNPGYWSPGILQVHCMLWQNIAARHQGRYDLRFLASMNNATTEPGMWRIGTDKPAALSRDPSWLLLNSYFPDLAANAHEWAFELSPTDSRRIGRFLNEADVFGVAFIEDDWDSGETPVTIPSFISHPLSQTVDAGDTVTLSVLVTGSEPISYQWRKDGMNLPGQISATLVLSSVTTLAIGFYSCIASNSAGATTSLSASLTVLEEPSPGPTGILSRSAHAPQFAIPT